MIKRIFLSISLPVICLTGGAGAEAQQTLPVNMGPAINSAARDAEPTFMPDGNTMYFNCFDRQGRTGSRNDEQPV